MAKAQAPSLMWSPRAADETSTARRIHIFATKCSMPESLIPNGIPLLRCCPRISIATTPTRSEEHTSELQSHHDLVCRLLLEKKKKKPQHIRKLYITTQQK